jgi:hypothetical protein
MSIAAHPSDLAQQARRVYAEALMRTLPAVVSQIENLTRLQASVPAEPALGMRRRELVMDLQKAAPFWLQGMQSMVRGAMRSGIVSAVSPRDLPAPGARDPGFTLVDDDTIENEILSSRLALAMMDRASWEFTDLRTRIGSLEGREELDANDVLRPHVLARIVTASWRAGGLSLEAWKVAQPTLHDEFAQFVAEQYHDVNAWLVQRKVLPHIDLRPLIRRTSGGSVSGGYVASGGGGIPTGSGGGMASGQSVAGAVGEETRMLTRSAGLSSSPAADQSQLVLGRLNRLIARQVPDFQPTAAQPAHRAASSGLRSAISLAQQGVAQRFAGAEDGGAVVSTPALLDELSARRKALKQAASSPTERATIEIVALLFQSILTEERIPSAVRVWFARLQMPVLRVAVSEPDFFATIDHPARRLIDRMGACVMGFDSSSRAVGDLLEKEIKRVVQVVEAYPDTGRRVFQTVLTEFEKFLEHYFKNENEASRKSVSLAQQIEQRETMAIQYTIELRKMLDTVPVQEGIREFLFQVWADVMAMTALKTGVTSEQTKTAKKAAADLIWSAGAKVSREERADVLRRLPPLLKALREGMEFANVPAAKQEDHIARLNNSLAAAFTAKAAVIPAERLDDLTARLETLEELLPDAEDLEIDESMVLDLSGHESSEIEVVSDGGSMPTPAMLAWARELQVGGWFMLDHNGRNEPVQLAWQGLRRQLTLFVSASGRAVLFQKQRLAAFLQAGLLLPAQEESLTTKATRTALAKLDADPARLLQ